MGQREYDIRCVDHPLKYPTFSQRIGYDIHNFTLISVSFIFVWHSIEYVHRGIHIN